MIFVEWKTRSLLRKNAKKSHFFFAFRAFFPNFWKIEKNLQVQKHFRIFTVAACKYTGDHRQIMGRSWATSRPYRNQVSKKKFAKNFSRKKVSRANFVIILILHVKLSKRYPIVRKKRTIFLYCLIVRILDETPHPVKF